jgi:hypothetical protein
LLKTEKSPIKHSLFRLVFFLDCLLRIFGGVRERPVETDETLLEVVYSKARLLNHGRVPGSEAEGVTRQSDAGGADDRRDEMEVRLAVEKGKFREVLSQAFGLAVV